MTILYGNDNGNSMSDWGEDREEWLQSFLELPHGSPSQDLLLWVFMRLDPQESGTVFVTSVAFLRERVAERICGNRWRCGAPPGFTTAAQGRATFRNNERSRPS